jgi:hypothetical protein
MDHRTFIMGRANEVLEQAKAPIESGQLKGGFVMSVESRDLATIRALGPLWYGTKKDVEFIRDGLNAVLQEMERFPES